MLNTGHKLRTSWCRGLYWSCGIKGLPCNNVIVKFKCFEIYPVSFKLGPTARFCKHVSVDICFYWILKFLDGTQRRDQRFPLICAQCCLKGSLFKFDALGSFKEIFMSNIWQAVQICTFAKFYFHKSTNMYKLILQNSRYLFANCTQSIFSTVWFFRGSLHHSKIKDLMQTSIRIIYIQPDGTETISWTVQLVINT